MAEFIAKLCDPRCYPHPVSAVRLIETHISWVLLTGAFAYKIKKPVRLDFVDFSTLERRRHYCFEELRLNRRLAPELYLDVVPITGCAEQPRIDGAGVAFEYALKMREFPQESLLAHTVAQGTLLPEQVDAIADTCVSFHGRARSADPQAAFGAAAALLDNALENFACIEELLSGNGMHLRIAALKRWTREEHARLCDRFAERRKGGRIRECHGDLHLGNIALIDGRPTIFDCIEFNEAFRWVDVMNEIAFISMDLAARGRTDFAYRLLNRYLDGCGDYAGLSVFKYYLVYRAMVRAKIDCIRARQPDLPRGADTREWQDFVARIALAESFIQPRKRMLTITHGVSGSGKSTAAQYAAEHAGMIRIRSDVERKRLFGLQPGESSGSSIDGGIYGARANALVYERLAGLASACIDADYPTIVDATFLCSEARNRFRRLAASLGANFAIISCNARETELRARIERRLRLGSDPSEASLEVLRRQQQRAEALDEEESALAIAVEGADRGALPELARSLNAMAST